MDVAIVSRTIMQVEAVNMYKIESEDRVKKCRGTANKNLLLLDMRCGTSAAWPDAVIRMGRHRSKSVYSGHGIRAKYEPPPVSKDHTRVNEP